MKRLLKLSAIFCSKTACSRVGPAQATEELSGLSIWGYVQFRTEVIISSI
jgi:hypothetical protein